jgi:hypothetical protein
MRIVATGFKNASDGKCNVEVFNGNWLLCGSLFNPTCGWKLVRKNVTVEQAQGALSFQKTDNPTVTVVYQLPPGTNFNCCGTNTYNFYSYQCADPGGQTPMVPSSITSIGLDCGCGCCPNVSLPSTLQLATGCQTAPVVPFYSLTGSPTQGWTIQAQPCLDGTGQVDYFTISVYCITTGLIPQWYRSIIANGILVSVTAATTGCCFVDSQGVPHFVIFFPAYGTMLGTLTAPGIDPNCPLPAHRYRCDPDLGCVIDPNGPYGSIGECRAVCPGPR